MKAKQSTTKTGNRAPAAADLKARKESMQRGERAPSRVFRIEKRADGSYTVKLTVASTKFRSDEKGEEKPVANDDWIDIGVLGEKDKVLFLEKRRITKPVETFELVVGEKPAKAGIDPFNKLIDRNPKDNVKSL